MDENGLREEEFVRMIGRRISETSLTECVTRVDGGLACVNNGSDGSEHQQHTRCWRISVWCRKGDDVDWSCVEDARWDWMFV